MPAFGSKSWARKHEWENHLWPEEIEELQTLTVAANAYAEARDAAVQSIRTIRIRAITRARRAEART